MLLVRHKHPSKPVKHVRQLHPLSSRHYRGDTEAGEALCCTLYSPWVGGMLRSPGGQSVPGQGQGGWCRPRVTPMPLPRTTPAALPYRYANANRTFPYPASPRHHDHTSKVTPWQVAQHSLRVWRSCAAPVAYAPSQRPTPFRYTSPPYPPAPQVTILWCKECGRYLQPPKHWVQAELESKELLTFCIKKVKGLQKVGWGGAAGRSGVRGGRWQGGGVVAGAGHQGRAGRDAKLLVPCKGPGP